MDNRSAGLTPGYPRDFERRLCLRDGREIGIRPILPSDAPSLAAAIRAADSDTLHRRFMGAPPHVTPALLVRLTKVDYHDRFALVAIDPGTDEGVAIARYEPTGAGVAEIALVVDPRWRQAGLGTALVHLLAEAAAQRGIHTLTACYLAKNHPVAALASHAKISRLIKKGVADISVPLSQETRTSPDPTT